jgi:hypothetical protein
MEKLDEARPTLLLLVEAVAQTATTAPALAHDHWSTCAL